MELMFTPSIIKIQFVFFCLMEPALCKGIQYHVCALFLCLQNTRSGIKLNAKRTVSLVTANGQLIILMGLRGYVWVNMLTLSQMINTFIALLGLQLGTSKTALIKANKPETNLSVVGNLHFITYK